MSKQMKRMIISLLVVFGGIIAFNLIKAFMIKRFFAHYEPPAVSVSSAIAQAVNWQPQISAVGNFVAIDGVEVNSEQPGKVVKINFESGQYVEKNAPLIDIDDSVDQAVLKFNLAELALKQLNFQRQTDLYKRGATPISLLDEAKANLNQAEAKVEQIQAQIKQKHIVAPFPGQLGILQVDGGQYINPGLSSIVSLQSMDPLYLEFYLPEELYNHIRKGQNVRFSIEEFPNIVFNATLTAINSRIDLNTHNVLVQATLPNCPTVAIKHPNQSALIKTQAEKRGSRLIVTCNTELNQKNKITDFVFIPGMYANVDIAEEAKPGTIIVPSTAISYGLYGSSVYLIDETTNSNGEKTHIARRVFVTTGEQQGNNTVILKGIKAGQLIVASGDLKLQNGTAVTINNSVPLNAESNPNNIGE